MIVPLVEREGQSFVIAARVAKALKKAGAQKGDVDECVRELMSSDGALLAAVQRWVTVT